MKISVLTPKRVVFEGTADSVFVPGDSAEFELLNHHAPIISLLREGHVWVDWKTKLRIKNGMLTFDRDECVILIEE